jgi:peroxiredoxin
MYTACNQAVPDGAAVSTPLQRNRFSDGVSQVFGLERIAPHREDEMTTARERVAQWSGMSSGIAITTLAATLSAGADDAGSRVPEDATQVCPVLTGAPVPSVVVRDGSGAELDLAALVDGKPTVLVFYRGGWCPYCNRHLSALSEIESRLIEMGYQILALSPDRPDILPGFAEEGGLGYTLLSDSQMRAARAFGLAFRLSDEQYERLRGFGHDLEADSGETHHELPVPAAFVIGPDGLVHFSYVNPNYRVRVDADVLLAAAGAALADADDAP